MDKYKYQVSILVPIYNVEAYIERCVRSLFEQTFQSIEYVFIDDCSPDSSLQILKNIILEYPNKKDSIKIICNKNNLGLGFVRNQAISVACGKFILHVDSDDFIANNAVELLYNEAVLNKADIVTADFYLYYDENNKTSLSYKPETDPLSFFRQLVEKRIPSYICNKLIRTSLYKKYDIKVPLGINFMEDFSTLPRLVFYSKKIVALSYPLYYYQQNRYSYCNNLTANSITSAFKSIKTIESFIIENYIEINKYAISIDICKLQTKLMLTYAAPKYANIICNYYEGICDIKALNYFNFRERILLHFISTKDFKKINYTVKIMKSLSFIKVNLLILFNKIIDVLTYQK